MVDLALHSGEAPVLRQDIAERQDISADYVAQLFRQLRSEGLVEGVKGPGGGYRLALPAADISVGDVIRAVEGPVAVVHCAVEDDETPCNRVDRCVAHLMWQQLSEVMTEYLDSITLQDLCDQARNLSREGASDNGKHLF
jgi:Rrf2 family protein